MSIQKHPLRTLSAASLAFLALTACQGEPAVSFANDVKPVLDQFCVECHQPGGAGYEATGFSMASHAELLEGTDNGAMVVPGDSMGSNLIVLMEGRADPSIRMPHGNTQKVAQFQIDKIKQWIDAGALDN